MYDIDAERTELNNLSEAEPKRLADMAERWEAWAEKALAKPWPWGGKGRNAGFSKKQKFTLKQGDHLPQTQAPMVRGKGFTVEARVAAGGAAPPRDRAPPRGETAAPRRPSLGRA